ncbi:MAG: hypothetical protein DSZ31_03020 [Gammaproteobacteria bacterium]|nr:MAG: hypothetical protein DSZ31_03020 [Gammaproteobacteria bacterium]
MLEVKLKHLQPVNGKHYPFEAHFVHSDRKGNLAVMAVFFKLGKKNPYLEKILHYTPTRVGEEKVFNLKG